MRRRHGRRLTSTLSVVAMPSAAPLATLALLHPLQDIGWPHFTVHWSTVAGLTLFAALYFRAAAWMERATPRLAAPTLGQRARFVAAILLIFVSLNGPIHDLSDYYLFSGHMVQHLLLTLVMPPLLVSSVPGDMLRPLLRRPAVAAVARWLTKPAVCFALFNVVIAAWHLPPLYNLAMAEHPVHIVEHLMFMVTAVLMWWPYLSPLPELPRLAYPGQMLYSFLMSLPMTIVAICITMADQVLYPAYAAAPRIWGISPLQDQQIGGLIMWIPGGLFFYAVMTVVFFKWSQRQEDSTAGAQVDWVPGYGGSRL